jgi:hypothetical protein
MDSAAPRTEVYPRKSLDERFFPGKSRTDIEAALTAGAKQIEKTRATVHYLLCFVKETNVSRVEPLISEVFSQVRAQGGVIMSILPPVLLAGFGILENEGGDVKTRLTVAVENVTRVLPDEVRMVFGSTVGQRGMFEFGELPYFGIVLSDMQGRLRALLELQYGESVRMD